MIAVTLLEQLFPTYDVKLSVHTVFVGLLQRVERRVMVDGRLEGGVVVVG